MTAKQTFCSITLLALSAGFVCGEANAVEANSAVNATSLANAGTAKNSAKRKTKTPKQKSDSIASVEAGVLRMVDNHLPELKPLLSRLRADQPAQYALAVRDLAKSVRRLESAKNRDEELFDLEVKLLKSQSEVKMLTAKLKVRDSEKDREALREALRHLHESELNRWRYDVRVLKQRIERTEQLLSATERRVQTRQEEADEQLEKNYTTLLRKAGRQPKSSKPKSTK